MDSRSPGRTVFYGWVDSRTSCSREFIGTITLLPNLAVRSRPDLQNVRMVARETPTSVAARATETAIGLSGIAVSADTILYVPPCYSATSHYTSSVQERRGCLPRARRRFCGRRCLLLRTRIPVTTRLAESVKCRSGVGGAPKTHTVFAGNGDSVRN